ncbi:hypothetical protein I314_04179 [Cryptococcus bacillisporus CA1873]|uniref:rRNA-processing protein FYV7 n=1 Tax=Cryptococcus bacillisporus CA1873 TaxID=1296111 RepID=A0ABR5B831_CRYGA|nr:hypothetical protein I314_04179 [Cryptococcus bacillisporus CA1873]|eukprot:KIR59747.1 hypothetical protein I314_04179 [Cryptococcus gattii CA1873]
MPRVTRKQKDSGKAKPRAKSAPNASAKQGFKTAPSRAPKDAYLGKARKIKTDLIQRAKVKKQFAKVLRAEGMESERLGDGSRRRNEREEGDNKLKGRTGNFKGKERREREERGEEDPDMARIRARAGPSSSTPFSRPNKPFNKSHNNKSYDRTTRKPRIEEAPPKPKVRALSPSPPPSAPSSEPKPSIRTLKKEGFSKYHRAKDTTGLSKGRGQPNMGARMGVLLEKIKRM